MKWRQFWILGSDAYQELHSALLKEAGGIDKFTHVIEVSALMAAHKTIKTLKKRIEQLGAIKKNQSMHDIQAAWKEANNANSKLEHAKREISNLKGELTMLREQLARKKWIA